MRGRSLSQDTLCFDSGDEIANVFNDDEEGADLKAMGFGMYGTFRQLLYSWQPIRGEVQWS